MTKETDRSSEPGKPTEIERKFVVYPELLAELANGHQGPLDRYPHKRIAQGYLANSPEGTVRIRQKGDRYFWTFKTPTDNPAVKIELETEITKEQFETMWPGTEGRRLEKTRYEMPAYDGIHVIELDVYEGDLAGYALAEVEFTSIADADAFRPPMLFGAEVTADPAYSNANIAENGFPEVPGFF